MTIMPPHRLEILPDLPISTSSSSTSPKKIGVDISDATRPTPGANAFAQQKKAKEDRLERHRMEGNFWYYQKKTMPRDSNSGKGSTGLRVRDARFEPEKSPAMTTMSPFITAGAGCGNPGPVSPLEDLKLVPDDTGKVRPTEREAIEYKGEKRLHTIMGQPSTPSPTDTNASFIGAKFTPTKPKVKIIHHDRPKSPTKRFFDKLGIGMPSFTKSSPEVPRLKTMSDNVPPKAAQVLGTSSPQRAKSSPKSTPKKDKNAKKPSASVPSRFDSRALRGNISVPMDPADVVSFVPNKVRVQQDGLFSTYPPASSARVRSQSLEFFDNKDRESLRTGPPTPPGRDAPPNLKIHIPEKSGKRPELIGSVQGQQKSVSHTQAAVLVNPGNLSPTRTGGFAAKQHVTSIEKVPSVYSMRAALDIVGDDDSKSSLGRHSFRPRNSRWSDGEKEQAWESQGLLPGGRLPPTLYAPGNMIYSPSIYSTQDAPKPDSPTIPQSFTYEVSKYVVNGFL